MGSAVETVSLEMAMVEGCGEAEVDLQPIKQHHWTVVQGACSSSLLEVGENESEWTSQSDQHSSEGFLTAADMDQSTQSNELTDQDDVTQRHVHSDSKSDRASSVAPGHPVSTSNCESPLSGAVSDDKIVDVEQQFDNETAPIHHEAQTPTPHKLLIGTADRTCTVKDHIIETLLPADNERSEAAAKQENAAERFMEALAKATGNRPVPNIVNLLTVFDAD